MEPELEDKAAVIIECLSKSFNDKVAVDNLSLTMYEGQITALLGHNGAGKTTTMTMLTGLTRPSSGHCTIYGQDIGSDMKDIRGQIGICPQHSVLFDTLSVSEHLHLYCAIKGIPSEEAEAQVTDHIQMVGLTEKRHVYAMALSGGMKRKLSVAIALLGDSKVVFLDEA